MIVRLRHTIPAALFAALLTAATPRLALADAPPRSAASAPASPTPTASPGPAPSAPPPPALTAREAAREKAARGLEHFEARRWAEAYSAFREADALFHAPTLTLAMAQCQEALGHLLAARALYRAVVAEPVSPADPGPFKDARATAQRALDALVKRIPTLAVTVIGPDAERARVLVDGAPVPLPELAAGRELDPGAHVVTAETDAGGSARLAVTLPEGAPARAELVLQPRPFAAPVAPSAPRPGSIVPAGIAFGLGAAGLAAGVAVGVSALSISNDIRSRCRTIDGELHCLASDAPARDTASTLATASTVTFVAAGAALVAGTVLAIVRPGGSAPALEVRAGPASLHVRGTF